MARSASTVRTEDVAACLEHEGVAALLGYGGLQEINSLVAERGLVVVCSQCEGPFFAAMQAAGEGRVVGGW